MEFEEALKLLKAGKKLVNKNWNGKHLYVRTQNPDKHSMNTEPYIVMVINDKFVVPWTPNTLDLWSDTWEVRDHER